MIVDTLKAKNFWVLSVDMVPNDSADANALVDVAATTLVSQCEDILSKIDAILNGDKIIACISQAGGWAGGNASNADFIKNTELTIKQSIWSSAIACKIAANYVAENGLLVLPGAAAALGGTSFMIGYGASKAAVHQMCKSMAQGKSGLAAGVDCLSTLPVTIDTPNNRKFMSDADWSTWTPREYISNMILGWIEDKSSRPANGSLVKMVTKNNVTSIELC